MKRKIFSPIAGLSLLTIPAIAFAQSQPAAQGYPYYPFMHYNMMGYGYGYGFFPFEILMVVWWVIIIVLIVSVIRWIVGGRHHRHWMHGSSNALDILKERFAKGEIDKKEYEERSNKLMEM